MKKADIFLSLLSTYLISSRAQASVLSPASDSTQAISDLFFWLVAVATMIWFIFMGLLFYAYFHRGPSIDSKKSSLFIVWGGVIMPIIIISISVYFGLIPLPKLLSSVESPHLHIKISGLQWWWRVKYDSKESKEIELANEIWLPINRPVQLILTSEDVIHSFWVPSLAGKMDMIPGRTNYLNFTPKKLGEYSGICAEYCGDSHALMRLKVKVVSEKIFNQWLENQAQPANPEAEAKWPLGKKAFVSHGCIACHRVRGMSMIGNTGPDLTHVGSRSDIGSGILKRNISSLHRWINQVESIKPGVKMPNFDYIPTDEQKTIAHWLEELK